MKRVLQILGGLLVVVALVYWLLIDHVIKWVIESEGTREVKARVELDRVEFHLYPTSIALYGLQVTNPGAPMHNLLQAERVSLDLDLKEVLGRRIVADEMQLNGLAFNRERSRSGAVPGLTPPPAEPADYGLAGRLPSVSLEDAKELVAAEKDRIREELQRIQDDFKAIEDRWKQQVEAVPDQTRIADYKARAKALEKGGNALQRLSDLNELRKDISGDLKGLSGLEGQLKADLATVQQQLEQARALPGVETQRLLAKAGMDTASLDEVVKVLFGPRIAELLAEGLSWYQQAQAAEEESGSTEEPEWLILVKKTVIDGQLELGGTRLGFDGVAHNLTPQQSLWQLPIHFTLNGEGDGDSQFSASGSIDHIDPERATDLVEFALTSLPLHALKLSEQSALSITLANALADLSGSLRLDGDQLSVQLVSQFQQAVLETVAESGNVLAQAIADALQGITRFGIDLTLSGGIDDLHVDLRSDLDRILGQAVGGQLQAQLSRLQGQIREQLEAEVGTELTQLQDLAGQLRGLDQLLSERRKALNEVL